MLFRSDHPFRAAGGDAGHRGLDRVDPVADESDKPGALRFARRLQRIRCGEHDADQLLRGPFGRRLGIGSPYTAIQSPAPDLDQIPVAMIDRVEVISPKDIQIEKTGSGVVLSATYTTRIPLIYNVNACLDFNPTSR